MQFPYYRHTALRYYDAFRGVAEDCWAPILAGCKTPYDDDVNVN